MYVGIDGMYVCIFKVSRYKGMKVCRYVCWYACRYVVIYIRMRRYGGMKGLRDVC